MRWFCPKRMIYYYFGGKERLYIAVLESAYAEIRVAEHIAKSQALTNLTNPAIDAIDVRMLISSFCFFRVANRHTFGTLFGRDLTDPARREHYRRMLGDIVVGHLTSPGGAGGR